MSRQTATIRRVNATPPSAPADAPFDVTVPADGYRWWYLDGLSDCGRHGIVVIAFVGSVFSPYYYRARQRGCGDPEHYCAINVALYSPSAGRWAMTERGRAELERHADAYRLGPSALHWRDDALQVEVRERSAPFARPVVGRVRVHPELRNDIAYPLDIAGRHRWQPLAPAARIDVQFQKPSLRWRGHAYLDTNAGERPLEDDFESWNWSRTHQEGATRIHYNVTEKGSPEKPFCVRFGRDGRVEHPPAPPRQLLPPALWRVARPTRCAAPVRILRPFEDAPFYTRSLLAIDAGGKERLAVHESLSMTRFVQPWVRALLPFRMPRRAGRQPD